MYGYKRNVGCRWHFPNCDTLKMYHMARENAAVSSLVFCEYYVLSGQLSNGQYLRAYGDKKTNYPAKKCRIIRHNEGLVFVA